MAVAALVASGCASYTERTRTGLRAFQRGQLEKAREFFSDPDNTGSPFLSGAEAGCVALTLGDWDLAVEHLQAAVAEVAELEDRTLLTPDAAAEELTSWVLNDTSRAYLGEGFERVYLHGMLAMAYLARGDRNAVYVEKRRANALLEQEEKLYEKSYAAGGLGHFVSALAYELDGEPDQAYIDYRRMEEKGVGLQLAGRALVRLATQLRYTDEVGTWVERYGEDLEHPENAASVVVIAGVGLAPFKVQSSLTIPTGEGLWRMAVPGYSERPQPVGGVRLVLGANESVRTDVIEDVGHVAIENLEDRLAWTAARSAVRGFAKRELTDHLEEEHGLGGRLLGDIFTLVTEQADLRCWTTLPDTWQAARLFVPPGIHGLKLEAVGGERVTLGTFELEPGETMIVLARTVGTDLYAHAVGGRLVSAPVGAPEGEAAAPPVSP